MFMGVAVVCMGPQFPNWLLTFEDATEEEKADALRVFGEPYNVVGAAQFQIGRGWDGKGYLGCKVSWECGSVSAATFADLAAQVHPWKREPSR